MNYKIVSIIIPVFNEEEFILEVLERVIKADTLGLFKEIIVVDDGSTDSTVKNLQKFISETSKDKTKYTVNVIKSDKNEGKGASLKRGFMKSTGDIVIVQDADLEYHPEDYPLLLMPFLKYNAEVVYGSRFITDKPRRVLYFWHYTANVFLTSLSNIFANVNLSDMETGYKVFKGEIIRKIAPKLESKRFGFEPEITARIAKLKNIAIYEVGISYRGRTYDEGKKIGWKDGVRALWEIVKYNLKT